LVGQGKESIEGTIPVKDKKKKMTVGRTGGAQILPERQNQEGGREGVMIKHVEIGHTNYLEVIREPPNIRGVLGGKEGKVQKREC